MFRRRLRITEPPEMTLWIFENYLLGHIVFFCFWGTAKYGSKRLSFDIASKRWCGMQSNHLERSIGNSPTKFLLRFLFHWIKIINESNYSAHTSLPVFRYESIHHYTSTRLVSFTKLFRKFQKKMIFNTKRS